MGNCLRLGISRVGLAWTKRRANASLKKKSSISILILGTQATGKTTIGLRLWKYKKSLPDLNYVQTKGFNTYAIRRKNKIAINLYDLGGHPSIQELWGHYFSDAHGIIFVVDVSDQARLSEAATLFGNVLNDERIRGKPVLLLANKQDLGGASEIELDSIMNLHEVVNVARCLTRLDQCSATDLKQDKGIFEGFRWLVSHIEKNYHELNDRVMADILEEKNREKARIAAIKENQVEIPTQNAPEYSAEETIKEDIDSNTPSKSPKLLRGQIFSPSSTLLKSQKFLQSPGKSSQEKASASGHLNLNHDSIFSIIRSRPSSSKSQSRNPFLILRNVATAPALGRNKKDQTKANTPEIFLISPRLQNEAGALNFDGTKITSVSSSLMGSVNSNTSNSNPTIMAGRLSPEGADSEDGIINPCFENDNEEPVNLTGGNYKTTPVDSFESHVEKELSPKIDFSLLPTSPNKFRRLVRTESSDTERASEILLVTTLVQVHQDHSYKDRRGSTTSTRDSLALSLSSVKSDDMNNTTTNNSMEESSFAAIPDVEVLLNPVPTNDNTLTLVHSSSPVPYAPPSFPLYTKRESPTSEGNRVLQHTNRSSGGRKGGFGNNKVAVLRNSGSMSTDVDNGSSRSSSSSTLGRGSGLRKGPPPPPPPRKTVPAPAPPKSNDRPPVTRGKSRDNVFRANAFTANQNSGEESAMKQKPKKQGSLGGISRD